ncbi:hypothetical protein BDW60DRAFT_201164 [Aspergillus nidulans var. acristatus]
MAPESRHKPLTVEDAIPRLHKSSVVISRRGGFNKNETKRVDDAKSMLERGKPAPGSISDNRRKYWEVLQKVYELSGWPMVYLCAAALGFSVISNMRESVRIDLPYEIEARKETFLNPNLLCLAYPDGVPVPTQTNDSAHQITSTAHPPEERDTTSPDITSLTTRQTNPAHTIKHLQSVSLNLQLRDLIEFLQKYETSNQQLQMECPFIGDPLPFIRFDFGQQAELHATLEFSQPLATLFIQYVMSRGAGGISG